MKRLVLIFLSAFTFISLASIPARAGSNLMKSMKSIDPCRYTVASDYSDVVTQGKGISTSYLIQITFDLRNYSNQGTCYIYYVQGSPGTYITAYRSSKNRQRLIMRWSTNNEIQYALNNLYFEDLGETGVAKSEFTNFEKQLAN